MCLIHTCPEANVDWNGEKNKLDYKKNFLEKLLCVNWLGLYCTVCSDVCINITKISKPTFLQ